MEARGALGALSRGRPFLAAVAVMALVLAVAAAGAAPGHRAGLVTAAPGSAGSASLADATPGGSGGPSGPNTPGGATAAAAPASGAGSPTAANGSSGVSNGAGGPSRPGAIYDQGVTDSTITLGGSTFTSGPAAVYGQQIAVGFAAGIAYVNDHGGINGRKVVLKIYDDGADPAKQLANTKRLVEVDKVFALSMVYAAGVGPYVAQQRIPVFHLGQFDDEFTNPWWFPVGGPQSFAAMSLANFGARKLKAKSVAIFYIDAGAGAYSKAFADQDASYWKAYGVKVPVEEAFSPTQTSCSDAISAASAAKVDFIDFEIDASKVINCGVQAQVQGYKPPLSWGGYLIGVPVIWQALGDESIGMYAFDAFGALYNFPDYQAYVHKVSSSTDTDSSVTASYFYSALLMRDAIAKLGNNITRQRLADVLNTFSNWQPGVTADPNQPSWTWRPQCHVALKGGYVIQIHKHSDGSLAWDQITPQFASTPLPPGVGVPAQFSGCTSAFSPTS